MTGKWFYSPRLRGLLTILLATHTALSSAAVTMAGTRVIYDARSNGETLKFTNRDSTPSVMQVWLDLGNEQSTPDTADAPFVVTPPIFRIEPGSGQTVRVLFTGKDLPEHRESVFYLNTLQIPSLNAAHAGQNQMLVMVRNRVKVFYRPPGLDGSAHRAAETLGLQIRRAGNGKHLFAGNTSGYYISIVNGSVTCGSHTASVDATMIAPQSEAPLRLKGDCPLDAATTRVTLHYLDDYGAVRNAELPVTAPGAG